MMIAFRHRHRKLEVIKSSSLTVSFAPIRFPPPAAAVDPFVHSFESDSISSRILSNFHRPLSSESSPSLSANARFAGGYWNLWIWPLTQPTGGRLSTAVVHRTARRRSGGGRRRKRGMPGEFGVQVARILRCWSRKSGPRSSCPWIVSRIAVDGIRTPNRTRLPPRAIRGSAAPPSAASVANEAINNRQ